MKKYFLHLLKKNLLPLACFTLFCIVLYVIPVSLEDYSNWNYPTLRPTWYYYPDLYHSNIAVALGILSVFIPIYLLSYKMNKRSVDMHYSLPLGKTKILLANFLAGLVMLYAAYTVGFLCGFITVAVRVRGLHLINYLYLYLASLIPAFILYAVTAFIYTRANTIVDGVLCVVGALFVLTMAATTLSQLFYMCDWYPKGLDWEAFLSFGALGQVDYVFGRDLWSDDPYRWFSSGSGGRVSYDVCELIGCILWALLAVAATVLLFMTEKNSKAENCGQISESYFCYKVQISLYAAMLAAIAAATRDVVALCAVILGALVLSVVYKRTIKIGKKYAIILGACIAGGILAGFILPAIA